MKILCISYNHKPYIGGIETYSNKLEEYLKKQDISAAFINKPYSRYKLLRLLKILFFSFFHLLRNKYDVVHLTNLNLWPLVCINLVNKNKTNFIINLHGLELVYSDRNTLLSKVYKFYVPYKFLNSKNKILFLCNSEQTLKLASQKINLSNLSYIPMGVDSCFQAPKSLSVDVDQFFYVGRIVKRKGISWFIKNVLVHFPEKKLLISGPILDKREFKIIQNSPQVTYLGVLNEKEIVKLHQESFITIFPNLIEYASNDFEGFGITFLEAIANGGLSMATLHQGVISSSLNGKIGVCLNTNSSDDWKNKIQEIELQGLDNRQKIISSSQSLIEKNFLWEVVFRTTEREYKKHYTNSF